MVPLELYYSIALSMIPGIGHIKGRQLLEHCGSAREVFENHKDLLLSLSNKKNKFSIEEILNMAKAELDYAVENKIRALSLDHEDYPKRLKECADRPLVIYSCGEVNLNKRTVISIVGSRNCSVQGRAFCRKLVADLAIHDPLIVSGLAYGIDITAHKAAMEAGLETVGVIGSGLKIIYPQKHIGIAKEMMRKGGLISDYPSETKLLPAQFAERNRIVAGLADATIVIESSIKGGSMITAGLAMDYNRDVYAVPGKPNDELSSGCNYLIKMNKAALVESAADIEYNLGLDQKRQKQNNRQVKLFQELSEEEQLLKKCLEKENSLAVDELSVNTGIPINQTSVLLLEMEFKGVVRSLPGKIYQLV